VIVAVAVAGVVVVIVAVWLMVTFNRLVRSRNQVADGWAGIDVQLTRRADLVPGLVETVKGYRDFESGTLLEVVDARSRAVNAQGPAQAGPAEQELAGSLKTVFATAEAYPDLKADASFRALQQQLSTLEEDIAFARRYYNAQVRTFNTRQETFPAVLAARPLGFRPAEYFQADADDREVPNADL
jgi:LemA protein